jgi:hypothetical protein
MKKFINKFFKDFCWHSWDYYNPYNRTCTLCNEHQVQFHNTYVSNGMVIHVDEWETMNKTTKNERFKPELD